MLQLSKPYQWGNLYVRSKTMECHDWLINCISLMTSFSSLFPPFLENLGKAMVNNILKVAVYSMDDNYHVFSKIHKNFKKYVS